MKDDEKLSRRHILLGASAVLSSTAAAAIPLPAASFGIGVALPPAEDLMQEHGVLERVILIYEELARRFQRGYGDPERCLFRATHIIRAFIQGHHERVEELLLFPALSKANAEQELVAVLVQQHQAGADITNAICSRIENSGAQLKPDVQGEMAAMVMDFSRMFRPHMARENTVLVTALRKIMTPAQYADFSLKVQQTQEKMVPVELSAVLKEVERIEIVLGINSLQSFTAGTRI